MIEPLDPASRSSDMELLTVSEAARCLRISRNLTYELIARHELPCVRLGRVIRIPRGALETWIRDEASQSAGRRTAPPPLTYR